MPTVADIAAALDRAAPSRTAAEWDNVGLLLGDPASPIARIMTCLTLTPDVAAEAIDERADLIVSHHPILFRAVKKLTSDRGDGRVVVPLARAGIAVYSSHTAFDNCAGGINDILCKRLGILAPRPLRPRMGQAKVKLVAFVPDADLAKVSQALFDAGMGVIGNYRECSFRLAGKGTFYGVAGSHPTIGVAGQREDVDEWRLEVVGLASRVAEAIRALKHAHSYEEPAFDVYPLQALPDGGEGRVGELREPLPLAEVARRVRLALSAGDVQVVGDSAKPIQRIALACGAAGEFTRDAIEARADLFITGEMRFHDILTARDSGLTLVLPGHYASERPAIEELADRLANDWPGVAVWASRRESNPLWRGE